MATCGGSATFVKRSYRDDCPGKTWRRLPRSYVPKSRLCPCRGGSEERRLPTGVERRAIARGSRLERAGRSLLALGSSGC